MGTKIGILLGVGAGYVLGTRAGREQYEKLRATAAKVRRAPIISKPLDAAGQKVSDLVREQGERVTDKVADTVKERLFGAPASTPPAPAPSASTSPTRTIDLDATMDQSSSPTR